MNVRKGQLSIVVSYYRSLFYLRGLHILALLSKFTCAGAARARRSAQTTVTQTHTLRTAAGDFALWGVSGGDMQAPNSKGPIGIRAQRGKDMGKESERA